MKMKKNRKKISLQLFQRQRKDHNQKGNKKRKGIGIGEKKERGH